MFFVFMMQNKKNVIVIAYRKSITTQLRSSLTESNFSFWVLYALQREKTLWLFQGFMARGNF